MPALTHCLILGVWLEALLSLSRVFEVSFSAGCLSVIKATSVCPAACGASKLQVPLPPKEKLAYRLISPFCFLDSIFKLSHNGCYCRFPGSSPGSNRPVCRAPDGFVGHHPLQRSEVPTPATRADRGAADEKAGHLLPMMEYRGLLGAPRPRCDRWARGCKSSPGLFLLQSKTSKRSERPFSTE